MCLWFQLTDTRILRYDQTSQKVDKYHNRPQKVQIMRKTLVMKIIRNILYSHNEHTQRFCLPPTCSLALGRCSLWRSWCLSSAKRSSTYILIGRPSTSRLSRSWQEDDQYLDIFLVRKPHLDAAKTTKVFVTLLLPFRNQVGIRDLLLHGVFNCVNVKSLPPGPVKKLVCKHHGMIKVYYDDTDVQTK